jgi:hypothetical protein
VPVCSPQLLSIVWPAVSLLQCSSHFYVFGLLPATLIPRVSNIWSSVSLSVQPLVVLPAQSPLVLIQGSNPFILVHSMSPSLRPCKSEEETDFLNTT